MLDINQNIAKIQVFILPYLVFTTLNNEKLLNYLYSLEIKEFYLRILQSNLHAHHVATPKFIFPLLYICILILVSGINYLILFCFFFCMKVGSTI